MINVSPGMKRTWTKKKTEDIRLRSIWENFSNRTKALPSIPNAKEHKVPQDVLHYVETTFENGTHSTRIPLVEELRKDGKGGLQVAEGSGETREGLFADVYWNLSRKAAKINTKGVENESTKYLGLVKEAHSAIMDWFASDKDYSCQKAIIERGDRYITEDQYWKDYDEVQTAPLKKIIHPNIAFPGMTAALTRNLNPDAYNYANDMSAISSALSNITIGQIMTLNQLDKVIAYANRFVSPLNWNSGDGTVSYVILISPQQALELTNDLQWINRMSNAEKRGPDNRAISGIIGRRLNALIVEDQRSPIFNFANGGAFEYVTVEAANTMDNFYGLGSLNRTAKGSGAAGTLEIARILGRGALGVPKINDVEFKQSEKDFGAQEELCGELAMGHNRMDFIGKGGRMKNISSALFFTPTTSTMY